MPLPPALAISLRSREHDAVHASELGLFRSADAELLALARSEGRIVMTADLDFPRLLALSRACHPSVILFRGGEWSNAEVIARADLLIGAFSPDRFEKAFITIDHARVRYRKLPLD